jgi:hypothetical protein
MRRERLTPSFRDQANGKPARAASDPDVRWTDIDPRLARSQPRLLAELRDAVLIELWQSARTSRFLRFVWDDVSACVTLTLDDFEGVRYARALLDYLDGIGYEPAIAPGEVAAARSATAIDSVETMDPIEGLLELMLSDRLAHAFFRDIATRVAEPVLADLLELIAVHKLRRVRHAARLIARRLEACPPPEAPALGASLRVRAPVGRPLTEIEVTTPSRVTEIRSLAARIELLHGVSVEDHLDNSA